MKKIKLFIIAVVILMVSSLVGTTAASAFEKTEIVCIDYVVVCGDKISIEMECGTSTAQIIAKMVERAAIVCD